MLNTLHSCTNGYLQVQPLLAVSAPRRSGNKPLTITLLSLGTRGPGVPVVRSESRISNTETRTYNLAHRFFARRVYISTSFAFPYPT